MSLALHRTGSIAAEPADIEDEADISALIARLTAEVNQVACEKTRSIQQITNQMKMLALNALIESSRAGAQGAGFAVVAQEVRGVGQQVETIARELESQLTKRTGNLSSSIERMTERSRGERMVDLSLNAIELIDRNLYERTCDVRWWATDSAVVDCAAAPDAGLRGACVGAAGGDPRCLHRLSRSVAVRPRRQCARQRPRRPLQRHRAERRCHQMVSRSTKPALRRRLCRGDVECQPLLGNAQVATYCASVRADGKANGKPIGVLAIHFDWEPQARAIVQGVRVGASDQARVLLVDSNFRVIAASDGKGLLSERVPLSLQGCAAASIRTPPADWSRSTHSRLRDLQRAGLVRGDPQRGIAVAST